MQLYSGYPNPYSNYPNMYQQPQMPVQYMDRLGQLQASQQVQMIPQNNPRMYSNINGGIVEDFNLITANDVPMDGNGAVFVKKDGSEIQVRNWTAQGTISTSVFKPVVQEEARNLLPSEEKSLEKLSEAFEGKFQELSEKIDRIEKALKGNVKKREVADDE